MAIYYRIRCLKINFKLVSEYCPTTGTCGIGYDATSDWKTLCVQQSFSSKPFLVVISNGLLGMGVRKQGEAWICSPWIWTYCIFVSSKYMFSLHLSLHLTHTRTLTHTHTHTHTRTHAHTHTHTHADVPAYSRIDPKLRLLFPFNAAFPNPFFPAYPRDKEINIFT